MSDEREYSPKRFAIDGVVCPACRAKVERDAKWCGRCGFTGERSLEMFGDDPPPLLPILDVVDFWSENDQREIAAAAKRFNKRFPQIRWRFCAVALAAEVSLPLFGFWMMNVCPLAAGETPEEREWTVVFLVDANSGRISVTAGYRAEIWLSGEMWETALAEASGPLARGQTGVAVVRFLDSVSDFFDSAWKRSRKQLSSSSRK